MYSATQVAQLFKTVRETIRNWAIEFENELSPSANPGDKRQRSFVDSDLEIFALISEMKGQGKLYADIHAALANGQRGRVPGDVAAIVPADTSRPTQLQLKITFLEEQIKELRSDRDNQAGQVEALTRELNEAKEKNERLARENAVLQYRLNEQGKPPKE